VSVGESPYAITPADGLLWIVRETDVVRVDPARAEVVGEPTAVARDLFDAHITAAGDTVYVSSWNGVYRLGEGLPVREPFPASTPEPEESRAPLAAETCERDNVMCIPLDSELSVAGAGFGSAWVGNVGSGETFGIARFDAETGEEVARLPIDGFVKGFAPDERWMWALTDASSQLTLLKIDPETNTVSASFDLGDAGNISQPEIAAGGGNVWVSLQRGSVTRIPSDAGDPSTTSYAADLPDYDVSNGPLHLAYDGERLWLSYGLGHLGAVDPVSGELVVYEDALGVNAYDIVVAGGAVWSPHQSAHGDNQLTYSSTSSPEDDRGRVLLEEAVPGAAATDGEIVWVVQDSFRENQPGFLVTIDARARERVGEPLEVDLGFQGDVAVGDGYVWVAGHKILYRVTPTD
jgi:streptogramin lyase